MSRRGRSNGSPISLFSFQDIITSVTAIMILLVLILTLELITRMNLMGVAVDDRRVANELHESLDTLRERLKELRSQAADAKKTAIRVAGQSRSELEADRRKTQRESETLATGIASLEAGVKEARHRRREAEKDLLQAEKTTPQALSAQEQAARDHAAVMALEKRNEDESKRQQDVEKDLASSPTLVSTLVFNPPKGEALRPILTEVSAGGIAAFNGNGGGVTNFGWGVLGPPSDFLKWLSQRDKHGEYIVIMLRPSGLDRLDATRQAVIAAGLQLGIELVSDDMDIVMSEDVDKAL